MSASGALNLHGLPGAEPLELVGILVDFATTTAPNLVRRARRRTCKLPLHVRA